MKSNTAGLPTPVFIMLFISEPVIKLPGHCEPVRRLVWQSPQYKKNTSLNFQGGVLLD